MAGQVGDDSVDSTSKTGSTAEWAVRRAEELDLEPHEFLEQVMRAVRSAETGDIPDSGDSQRVDQIDRRLEDLEGEVPQMIEDVRERVVQVKRETDGKAPTDHDHPGLGEQIEKIEAEVADLVTEIEAIEDRLAGGFDNFEEILSHLNERTDEIAEDLETLGNALVSLQERLEQVDAKEQKRSQADRLKTEAAKEGVRTARCEECGSKTDISLLSEASCPTCGATFQELDANPGFFGRSTLETGQRPALVGSSEGPATEAIESVASGETRTQAPDSDGLFPEEETDE